MKKYPEQDERKMELVFEIKQSERKIKKLEEILKNNSKFRLVKGKFLSCKIDYDIIEQEIVNEETKLSGFRILLNSKYGK